jgi:hypothetical protein
MNKALIFKEWLKTRKVFWVAFTVAILFAIYAVVSMNRVTTLKGVDHIWLIMLMKDNTFVSILQYLPVAIGIALGASQFVPEMTQKRLKLTLHLPVPMTRLIITMLSVGLAQLFIIFILQLLIVVIYDSTFLVHELVTRVALTTVPWYLAGFVGYLFTAAVCLEGTWRQRLLLALLGIGSIVVFFMGDAPEAYNSILLGLVLFVILSTLLPFRSVYRFKEGHQD